MRLKRIMVSLGVLICLFSGANAVAYADTAVPYVNEGISLMYEIACNPISDLDIANNTAYCTSSVGGTSAVSITITQTMQKYWGLWIWNDVKGAEWTKTENRNSVRLSNSISGLSNGKYRVKSVFTLTDSSGKSETITIYSNQETVS